MSALRRSSTYAYLPLYCRIQKLNAGRMSSTACGLCKCSRRRFQSLITRSFLFSSLDRQQRSTYISARCFSSESPCFQEMMSFKQKQAKHSVLIQLSSKNDIPCVLNLCKRYGEVKNMIVFVDKQYKFQVIAEFVHEESVQKLLSDTSLKNVTEVYPCQTRCLYFENKGKQHANITPDEVTDLSLETKSYGSKKPSSVSEMMVELYENEKMSDLSTRLRFLCCVMLQDALMGMFPHCIAFPFGSSVNGFGNDSSDLDLLLRLFSEEQVSKNSELFFHTKRVEGSYRILQRHTVYGLCGILQNFVPCVRKVDKIPNARVPIVEYHHHLLNLDCDVSINNMSAVYMSEILFFCGEFDPRIRPLMYAIKKWAKEALVTNATPGWPITNFILTLVMLFFLQLRKVPILPPLEKLIRVPLPDDYKSCAVEYLNEEGSKNLNPAMTWQNSESLGLLLQEFFTFVANFPFHTKRISLIAGTASSKNDGCAMSIDYPMDESFNVSKNISMDQLEKLRRSAREAAKNLERNTKTDLKATDLMSVLGLSDLKWDSSQKIDVRAFLDEPLQQKKVVTSVT